MASTTNSSDGLSTISEIKNGAYIWVAVVLCLSAFMVYNFAQFDRHLYDTKNKYIDPIMHRENRLSSTSLPHNSYDARTDNEFTKAVEELSK